MDISEYWTYIIVITSIYAIVSGCICVSLAFSKGYENISGAFIPFILGFLFGIFGILYYVGISDIKLQRQLDRIIELLEKDSHTPTSLTQLEKEILLVRGKVG
jgi:hypothetical protein